LRGSSATSGVTVSLVGMTSSPLGAALTGPLVSTQWLCDHLGSDGLLVLDASVVPAPGGTYAPAREQYEAAHVPGAGFADLVSAFSDPAGRFAFTRPTAETFAAAAAAVGVTPETTVVVYDSAAGQWAARLWWLFRSFGHEHVAVLDGGAVKWRAEERPVESGPASDVPVVDAVPAPASRRDFWTTTDEVAAILDGERPGTLVCGTPARDFAVRHIPGSVSAPASRLVDRATNALLPVAELRALFVDVLADPAPIVAYCGAGIAAAADALALAVLGRDDVTIYDGSLNEWAAEPGRPLTAA
jgi:thiosulfate/3-mercaptopyruvate sulfurtransferase